MKPKFTMSAYYALMDEIRERHKLKPTLPEPENLIERLRQVAKQRLQLPKLPRLPKI